MKSLDFINFVPAEEILKIVKGYNCYELFGSPTLEDYGSSFNIKIMDNDNIVGYVSVASQNMEAVNIWSLFIKPEYRGKGYAKFAISEIVSLFSKKTFVNGFKYIYGFVNKNNKPALEFYKKHYKFLDVDHQTVDKFSKITPLIDEEDYEVVFYYKKGVIMNA